MVSSSKKKRGKQRKAAKNKITAATATATAYDNTISNNTVNQVTNFIGGSNTLNSDGTVTFSMSFKDILHRVKVGDNLSTTILINPDVDIANENSILDLKEILSVVLDFLKRCEDESFIDVMSELGTGVGAGSLKSPSYWVKVLIIAGSWDPSCNLTIAQNIGPLVRCMCADTTRQFFKSNKHWNESIVSFMGLITYLVCRLNHSNDTVEKDTIDVLMQYDGLLATIIQWSFWEDELRPDIMRESPEPRSIPILTTGMSEVIERIVLYAIGRSSDSLSLSEGGKSILDIVATTPIVSKAYDPSCMVSYVAGLIQQAKARSWISSSFSIIERLFVFVDGVDKGVITEVIDLGTNFTYNVDSALIVLRISYHLTQHGIKKRGNNTSDTRTSYAIQSGLIEMCLDFIEQFGFQESFWGDGLSMSNYIRIVFEAVHTVSLHRKSSRAITRKRGTIMKVMARLEGTTNMTISINCEELLDMVRSILDLNDTCCCRCNKSIKRTDVKLCNGCNRMPYCSKACQKEDWSNGHKLTCCEALTNDLSQFQGRLWPLGIERTGDIIKSKELEININMIGLKLFLDNSETILSQATSLGIPLRDCVVQFDLCRCPTTVELKSYADYFSVIMVDDSVGDSRSDENITCVYYSHYDFPAADKNERFMMQRFFPHEWLVSKQSRSQSSEELVLDSRVIGG